MIETPEQIEQKVKTLKAIMAKHQRLAKKQLYYSKKTFEAWKQLEKFLKNEALGEP